MSQEFCFVKSNLSGVQLITPFHLTDDRGGLLKDYSHEVFHQNGIDFSPVETLFITSKRNVLRGLHYQRIKPQAKYIRCLVGHIWVVTVDLRNNSRNLGKWAGYDLTEENEQAIFIPSGYAVGTLAIDNSLFETQCGEKFYIGYDAGIRWDDDSLAIEWPINKLIGMPAVSPRDQQLLSFSDYLSGLE